MMLFKKEETGEQMRDRIRREIKAENERNLADPSLYLNSPHRIDGALPEAERDQIELGDLNT